MSELFPWTPPRVPGEDETTLYVDPTLETEEVRRRWELRTAQWRARALAEAVFGEVAGARLEGHRVAFGGSDGFRGLLHLDVPFRDLDSHRRAERRFVACATEDPVLARVPFVYLFNPASP